IALLASPGASWVAAFFGILLAGGTVVPLSPLYPPPELAWLVADSGATMAVVSRDLAHRASALGCGRVVTIGELVAGAADPRPNEARDGDVAVLLYTSGTTGRPKGAMLTHANLAFQAALLREAWGCSSKDRLLHALPLHHLHGLGVSLLTCL